MYCCALLAVHCCCLQYGRVHEACTAAHSPSALLCTAVHCCVLLCTVWTCSPGMYCCTLPQCTAVYRRVQYGRAQQACTVATLSWIRCFISNVRISRFFSGAGSYSPGNPKTKKINHAARQLPYVQQPKNNLLYIPWYFVLIYPAANVIPPLDFRSHFIFSKRGLWLLQRQHRPKRSSA